MRTGTNRIERRARRLITPRGFNEMWSSMCESRQFAVRAHRNRQGVRKQVARMCQFTHTAAAARVPLRMGMRDQLPPGPRAPKIVQTIGWWSRPHPFLERCRARYGKRFTIRLIGPPPFVMLSDPEELKELFKAPPDVLHPGEGAVILEPVVGTNSVILLDEGAHLEQRKLMLPAFHGERIAALSGLVDEVVERETAAWPRGAPVALHPRLQALTLEIILRAVFGLDPGPRLDALRARLTEVLTFGASPLSLLPPLPLPFGPWKAFMRRREEVDRLLFELIDERRVAAAADRDDVLTMLLAARHSDDGSPMSDEALRAEL